MTTRKSPNYTISPSRLTAAELREIAPAKRVQVSLGMRCVAHRKAGYNVTSDRTTHVVKHIEIIFIMALVLPNHVQCHATTYPPSSTSDLHTCIEK